jgi:hypothetical protein
MAPGGAMAAQNAELEALELKSFVRGSRLTIWRIAPRINRLCSGLDAWLEWLRIGKGDRTLAIGAWILLAGLFVLRPDGVSSVGTAAAALLLVAHGRGARLDRLDSSWRRRRGPDRDAEPERGSASLVAFPGSVVADPNARAGGAPDRADARLGPAEMEPWMVLGVPRRTLSRAQPVGPLPVAKRLGWLWLVGLGALAHGLLHAERNRASWS